tara:strand:+ start:2790 stop:2915 length:126 start_codon:yes stop_codon:yes gene_type:complete
MAGSDADLGIFVGRKLPKLMRLGENNFYFRETVRRMGGRGG